MLLVVSSRNFYDCFSVSVSLYENTTKETQVKLLSWFMKLSFYRFSDKTKNDWEDRNSFEKVQGKYDLLKMEYEANADVSVFSQL